ncbi:MAG: hypothetical protein AVDCRST_MAG86-2104, partial [uncultured Truepera sp.]
AFLHRVHKPGPLHHAVDTEDDVYFFAYSAAYSAQVCGD